MNERNTDSRGSGKNGASRFRHLFHTETISLAELGIQTFAVVLGILLALAINSWNESRHQDRTAQLAMQSILDETGINLKMLEQRTRHLENMTTAMKNSPANHDAMSKKPCYAWDGFSGLQYPQVIEAAYQTAISTQALAHIPFKQAESVAEVYSSLKLATKLYGTDGERFLLGQAPHSLTFCLAFIHELTHWNRHTIRDMQHFMREYNRAAPASKPVAPPAH